MKTLIYKLAIPAVGAIAAFSAVLVAAPSAALAWPFNTTTGCPSAQTYYSNGYSNVYCVPSYYPGYPQTPSIYPGVGNGFQNGYAYPTYPGANTGGPGAFYPANGSAFYPSGQVSPFYPQTNPFQQPVYNQPFYPYTPVPQYYYPPAPTYGWHY